MPELPEVETIRRQLAPARRGRTLDALEVSDARWSRAARAGRARGGGRRAPGRGARAPRQVPDLGARGRGPPDRPPADDRDAAARPAARRRAYARVRFALGDGHELWFDDPRRFGTGELALGGEARDAFFARRLGVEPLGRRLHERAPATRSRARARAPIKAFLLDQRKVAGVGNIYADEALFRARIHPLRPAARLTRSQCDGARATRSRDALEAGLDAKRRVDRRLPPARRRRRARSSTASSIHLREGEPCLVCGRPVRKLRAAGRGTYVCERCQPRPRRVRRRRGTRPGARRDPPRRAPESRRSARRPGAPAGRSSCR